MALYCIGDLQGCHTPFQRLLDKIDFSPSRDTLYMLGDLVNRGPESLQVLRSLSALGDAAHLAGTIRQVAEARERIGAIARENGLAPLPSATNFVAIDCGRDGEFARAVLAALGEQGVFARMPWVAPQNRCIRVSCGPKDELDAFAEALPKALARARG